jgi:hypothetical protein
LALDKRSELLPPLQRPAALDPKPGILLCIHQIFRSESHLLRFRAQTGSGSLAKALSALASELGPIQRVLSWPSHVHHTAKTASW